MKKTASSPEQDLHPDWDRFRGTMLYPLSCGELAMKGEKNFKIIWNKWSTCCKKEVNKDFVGEVFWPWNDILTKTSLFDSFMFKFNSVLEIRSRTTSFPWPFPLLGGGAPHPQVREKAMETKLGAGSKK